MPNPNLPIAGNFNTYVGARYVPKFADPIEWNQNTLYEPLTIVTYQGNSYTSRTFVPPGTDINNSVYWAQTGNFNAQLQELQNSYNSLVNQYNNLNFKLNLLNHNNLLLLGDEYCLDIESFVNLPDSLKLCFKNSNIYTFAEPGVGFTTNNNIVNMLLNASTALTIEQKNSISDIIIVCGRNETYDRSYYELIGNVMNNLHSNASTLFSNAKIWIFPFGQQLGSNDNANLIGYIYYWYTNWSALYNINVVNESYMLLHSANRLISYNTPNQQGIYIMARYIYTILNGGVWGSLIAPISRSQSGTNQLAVTSWLGTEGIHYITGSSSFVFDTPISLTGLDMTTIGKCINENYIFNTERNSFILVRALIYTGEWSAVNLRMVINNKIWTNGVETSSDVQAMIYNETTTSGSSTTINNITKMTINNGQGLLPYAYN